MATALVAWRRTILVTPLRIGRYCDFKEDVAELASAYGINFSGLADRREELKSASSLARLAGKKLEAECPKSKA
jgi:hypothetical protein